VPSLWRTCPNLIGPFIHPTAPETRSVARRAMPQSHVAPHHLVCSRAQSTRIICQCRLLVIEENRGRGHLSGATARLCMKLLRDRAGASSRVRHMPPRVYDNHRPRCVQCPWLPHFLARLPKVRFLNSRAAQAGGGGGGGGADEGKHRRVQAMGQSWKERPRLCGDPPLSPTAGPELGGARSSGRVFSARRTWCGNLLFPFTKKMKRHVNGFTKLRCGGPGMRVRCGAEFVAPQTRRHKLKRVSDQGSTTAPKCCVRAVNSRPRAQLRQAGSSILAQTLSFSNQIVQSFDTSLTAVRLIAYSLACSSSLPPSNSSVGGPYPDQRCSWERLPFPVVFLSRTSRDRAFVKEFWSPFGAPRAQMEGN